MKNESSTPDTDILSEQEGVEHEVEVLPGDESRLLLPVHAAPTVGGASKGGHALKVARKPGRPRKVERMPTTSDLEYHAAMSAAKDRYIQNDPVVKAALARGMDAASSLRTIKAEVAKEAAALRFQRTENEKYGKDTSQLSSRRIDALVRVAHLELEIKRLGAESIDFRGAEMRKVYEIWIGVIREVAEEVLPAQQFDLFFNKLLTGLDGWEARAEDALR
jgi:hypothetical protein